MGILETSIGQLGISLAIKISLVTTWLQSTQTLASGASFHNFLAIYTNTPGYPQHCWLLYHRPTISLRNQVFFSMSTNDHLPKECKQGCSISYRSFAIRPLTATRSVKTSTSLIITTFKWTWLLQNPTDLHKCLAEASRGGSFFASLVHCVHTIADDEMFKFQIFHKNIRWVPVQCTTYR